MAPKVIITNTGFTKRRKLALANSAVKRARAVLRARNVAPPRTGGFYGLYTRRGREELKTIDVATSLTPTLTGSSPTLLNGVATGTDYTNRIGRKILMKSLLLRLSIFNDTTTSDPTGDIIRVVVVYDCQSNGVAPAVTDVISGGFDGPMNLNNRDRFKILLDKFWTVPGQTYTAGTLTAGSPQPKYYKLYKKMSTEEIFSGTGATVGSIATGGIYIFAMSTGTTGNAVGVNSRIRFNDA